MTHINWDAIKQSKNFYVATYRSLTKTLCVSVFLNIILLFAIQYFYFHQPDRAYYATNGVTAPVPLAAMDVANDTAYPLLPPDPVDNLLSTTTPLPN